MALISDPDQQKLREIFADRLRDHVTIRCFVPPVDDPEHSGHVHHSGNETRQLLAEIAALTDRLRVDINEFDPDSPAARSAGVERAPALILEGHAKGRVRFFGLPSGYEFSTFVEDLLLLSAGGTDLSDETRAALARVAEPLHVQVFGTPT